MSQTVTSGTTAARNNAVSAVKISGNSRKAVEFIWAAVNALADAVEHLDERIDSDTRAASNLSAGVAECYKRADECARRARFVATVQARDDYLHLERSWIKLARCTQASERFIALDQNKQYPAEQSLK